MQIVLAQNHRASLPQPPHNFRILRRNTVLKDRTGSRIARARSIDQIFQGDRDPMQRPAPFTTRDLRLCRPSLRQSRLGSHRDESIQRWVELLDSIQAAASQFDRRNFLPPQKRGEFHDSFKARHRNARFHCSGRVDRRGIGGSVWLAAALEASSPKIFTFLYAVRKKQPTTKAYNQNRCLHTRGEVWRK